MAISTSPKPTIYRNLYENTSPGSINRATCLYHMDVEAIVGICQSALSLEPLPMTMSFYKHNMYMYQINTE